jgi:transcriptional regulator with XRE-family HTH domain
LRASEHSETNGPSRRTNGEVRRSANLASMHGGAVIARARRWAGISQSTLAERLGTTKSAISRWEHGQVDPSFGTVVRAARACSTSLGALLTEPEADPHDVGLLETARALSPSERMQRLIDMTGFIESARKSRGVPA